MKTVTSILIITILTSYTFSVNDDYNEGFWDGHCEGYIQAYYDFKKIEPNCPPDPVPLVPDPGRDKYKHGYNRGFQVGYIKAHNEIE